MTKALRKPQLQTKYFKNKSQSNYLLFEKQKNICSKLYEKERKISEKSKTSSEIMLKNKTKIIFNDSKVAEESSSFFENAVKSLNIEPSNIIFGNTTNLSDPVEIAIKKFENHLSVEVIKENICVEQDFDFEQVEIGGISKEIKI